MIPITRKELYLNKIVGNDNYSVPEKPITTEELFFAEILGEAVQAPEPLTRYQMYLAKIAKRDVEIPYPKTRLEYFLAKAAGMEIETPIPITREEIFWSNYTAIVEFEVEGVPPLTYKAIEGTLENYRIYGNTVGGESVGDLVESGEHAGEYKVPVTVSNGTDTLTTPIYLPEPIKMVGDEAEYIDYVEQKQHRVRKNLWSGVVEQGSVSTIGNYADDLNRIRSKNISLSPGIYTISCNLGIRCVFAYNNSEKVSCVVDNAVGAIYRNTFTVPSGANKVSVGLRAFDASGTSMDTVKPSDFKWGQIEKGSEATTYEPYIENTEVDVTLPALPTLSGTNTLTVGTEVQPSKVYIKGQKEREYS